MFFSRYEKPTFFALENSPPTSFGCSPAASSCPSDGSSSERNKVTRVSFCVHACLDQQQIVCVISWDIKGSQRHIEAPAHSLKGTGSWKQRGCTFDFYFVCFCFS